MKDLLVKIIGFVLSFPLRCYLSLYCVHTTNLVEKRKRSSFWKRMAYNNALSRMVDIPDSVKIGKNVVFVHNAIGAVIHPYTTIGDNVKIYQGVTIGRGNIWEENIELKGFEIHDKAVLCAGAKIICSKGVLIVGEGTIIAANAVLTCSTGDYEIWAGIPARKVGMRTDS